MSNYIRIPEYLKKKVMSAKEAALCIKNNSTVGTSGFTKGGDSKVVLKELAKRAQNESIAVTLISGASLGHHTDGELVPVLKKRLPFQADPILRKAINEGQVLFVDQHLSKTSDCIANNTFNKIDTAVIEVAEITADSELILTTSVGNNLSILNNANQYIIEVNTKIPTDIKAIHDLYLQNGKPINITNVDDKIGSNCFKIDPEKIVAIVYTDIEDEPGDIAEPDTNTIQIANHILAFLESEVEKGHLTNTLKPLQCGIGKVANAVLSGFTKSNFNNLTMYSEVLQDSTFELIDAGKLNFASASSLTLSKKCYNNVINNLDKYKDKIVLRPQNISNAPEVIKRLGIIAINTALEFDIYGNVNSTHVLGTNMMNGIGGSGDFARNASLSIFVTSSIAKNGDISSVVPMIPHVDHTEHDVDILVTEQGLADLRGLAPKERAALIIENCAHPEYKDRLYDYFNRALERGGQTPHILEEAFDFHIDYRKSRSMKKLCYS
jgi:acetyl-CoA hydrolase/succinyl-CoA:acetate CoA-transferase